MLIRWSFFFFQAEDGIRDHCVTGVQTCALPILAGRTPNPCARCNRHLKFGVLWERARALGARWLATRSEERRVGKECRHGTLPDNQKKETAIKRYNNTNTPTQNATLVQPVYYRM